MTFAELNGVLAAWANLVATIIIASVVYRLARRDSKSEAVSRLLNDVFRTIVSYKYAFLTHRVNYQVNAEALAKNVGLPLSREYVVNLELDMKRLHAQLGGLQHAILCTLDPQDHHPLHQMLETLLKAGNEGNMETFKPTCDAALNHVFEMTRKHMGLPGNAEMVAR